MKKVKTIFISDIHFGNDYCNEEKLLEFLLDYDCDNLYLVGDTFDGYFLSRRWKWRLTYNAVIRRIIQMALNGTKVTIFPGNHDPFIEDYIDDYLSVSVTDELEYTTVAGKKMLVVHGDIFDNVNEYAPFLDKLGSWILRFHSIFEFLDRWFNRPHNMFKNAAVKYAKDKGCDGIICGHSHRPMIEGDYHNIGDWLKHNTALIEDYDGKIYLYRAEKHKRFL